MSPRDWRSRSPPSRRAVGRALTKKRLRTLCADFKLGAEVEAADVDTDDSYESTSEAVSYAFEFAALFDGRHLASRTVGVLGTLAVDGDGSVRARAAALIGASSAGLDPPHVLTRAIPVLSALIEDLDGSVRCEAARALCVACESHPNDEAVVDAAHRTLETFVDSRDLDAIVATSEGMGRAGLRTPRTEHCARSAATLARVASREATAAAAAGPEALDGRVGDVGAALFAAIRAVLSSDENDDSSSGRQPSRLFETLAPALRRMLEVAPMLDASDRATAEAMLRDEDWRGAIEPLGQGQPLRQGLLADNPRSVRREHLGTLRAVQRSGRCSPTRTEVYVNTRWVCRVGTPRSVGRRKNRGEGSNPRSRTRARETVSRTWRMDRPRSRRCPSTSYSGDRGLGLGS